MISCSAGVNPFAGIVFLFRLLVSCIGIRASRLLFMERDAHKVQSYFQNYIFLIILRFLVNILMGDRILVVNLFLNFNQDDLTFGSEIH